MNAPEPITPEEWYEVLKDNLQRQYGQELNPEEDARVREAAAKMSEAAEKLRTRRG